jgi:hypothetical protein
MNKKTNIGNKFLGIAFLFLFSINSYSQYTGELTPAYYAYAQNRNSLISFNRLLPCVNKTLSVSIHILKDSLGQTNINYSDITAAFDTLNSKFSPICLKFKICNVDSISNFQWDSLDVNDDNGLKEEQQLITNHHIDSTINVYFVAAFNNLPLATGFASFPGGCDNIFILKDNVNDMTISHEFGHFFGLLHTFGDGNSQELVDASNCSTQGDFLCDTEADPSADLPSQPPSVNNYCELANPLHDANNQFYMPPTDNIMSYYGDCRCKFTNQQYAIMAYEYLTNRKYLW